MKQTITVTLIFLLLPSFIFAQNYTCGATSIVISDITCIDQGTLNPDDDVITFVVTGTNNSNDSIMGFPLGSHIDPNFKTGLIPNHAVMTFEANKGNVNITGSGSWKVTSPSPGCAPLDLLVVINNANEPICSDSPSNLIINPNNGDTIPTMGEWGLIILFLMMSISFTLLAKEQRHKIGRQNRSVV